TVHAQSPAPTDCSCDAVRGPILLTVSLFQCVLSGLWRNELGSNMTISAVNAEGGFTGSYHTAVTVTDKRSLVSPLKGSQNRKSQRKQPTFGFTVSWTFSNSMTVFVGQCFVDDNGEEILKTMWLLRKEVGSPSADWKATRWVTGRRFPRQRCSGRWPGRGCPSLVFSPSEADALSAPSSPCPVWGSTEHMVCAGQITGENKPQRENTRC
uniref:Avidin n=1 Tax=Terrapene triunguis TaxID=2587831 RepID=A0A674JUC5_9SAUR